MNAKKASDIKVSALQCAAGAVTDHNAELSSHLKRGLAIFTETPPISERLRCETNGAHKYIEDFATALKALPRGCAPVKRTLRNVRESCKELIRSLKETERLFPDSVPEADRRAFLDSIAFVASEELSFYNLVTGESGAEPDYPQVLYCRRINNSVNSIKKQFTQLNIAIQHIERDLQMKSPPAEAGTEAQGSPASRRKSRSSVTKADLRTAVKTILRGNDVNLPKPGPRLTAAKHKQIAAAEDYRKTHCGCTLHNACLKSFVPETGGYASGESLYESMRRRTGG